MLVHRVSLSLAGLVLIGATSAYAQTPGMICGTVTLPSGAKMVGVTVTLARTSSTSGSSRAETPSATATTDSKGGYLFSNVPVATYSLTFELPGFRTVVLPKLVVTDGFEARADPQLVDATMKEWGTFTKDVDIVSNVQTAAPTDVWQVMFVAPHSVASGQRVQTATGKDAGHASNPVSPHPCGASR
jgi:Carboxypeptidase regulatory-like domain